MYHGLVLGAYAVTLVLIFLAGLPWISIITFLSFPLALKLVIMVHNKERIPLEQFAMVDAATAQLHSAYGVLLIVALAVYYLAFL
jgi:1,4-dihydroxy-2-naphthoate octaprenyltransferase